MGRNKRRDSRQQQRSEHRERSPERHAQDLAEQRRRFAADQQKRAAHNNNCKQNQQERRQNPDLVSEENERRADALREQRKDEDIRKKENERRAKELQKQRENPAFREKENAERNARRDPIAIQRAMHDREVAEREIWMERNKHLVELAERANKALPNTHGADENSPRQLCEKFWEYMFQFVSDFADVPTPLTDEEHNAYVDKAYKTWHAARVCDCGWCGRRKIENPSDEARWVSVGNPLLARSAQRIGCRSTNPQHDERDATSGHIKKLEQPMPPDAVDAAPVGGQQAPQQPQQQRQQRAQPVLLREPLREPRPLLPPPEPPPAPCRGQQQQRVVPRRESDAYEAALEAWRERRKLWEQQRDEYDLQCLYWRRQKKKQQPQPQQQQQQNRRAAAAAAAASSQSQSQSQDSDERRDDDEGEDADEWASLEQRRAALKARKRQLIQQHLHDDGDEYDFAMPRDLIEEDDKLLRLHSVLQKEKDRRRDERVNQQQQQQQREQSEPITLEQMFANLQRSNDAAAAARASAVSAEHATDASAAQQPLLLQLDGLGGLDGSSVPLHSEVDLSQMLDAQPAAAAEKKTAAARRAAERDGAEQPPGVQKRGFRVCESCYTKICAGKASHVWETAYDFGAQVEALQGLSEAERAFVAIVHPLMLMLKVRCKTGGTGFTGRGNAISFPQNSKEVFAEHQNQLPALRDLGRVIDVHFIGPKGFVTTVAGEMRRGALRADAGRINNAFAALRERHPDYANMAVIENIDYKAQVDAVLARAVCSEDQKGNSLGQRAAARMTTDVEQAEQTEEQKEPLIMEAAVGMHVHESDANEHINKLLTLVTKQSETPMNEFDNNRKLMSGAFPHLFPTGSFPADNLPSSRELSYMFEYYDGRFQADPGFIILINNQRLRHGIAREAARVPANQVKEIIARLSKKEFPDDLRAAQAAEQTNPRGITPPQRELLQWCRKIASMPTKKIAFSEGERAGGFAKVQSVIRARGAPAFFLTISPSTVDNNLGVRLALPNGNDMEHVINMSYDERSRKVFANPGRASMFYKFILDKVLGELLGVQTDTKATRQRSRCGVLGRVTEYFCATECQGRSLLHAHILLWTEMSPEQISELVRAGLLEKIRKYIEGTMMSSMPSEYYEWREEKWKNKQHIEAPALTLEPDNENRLCFACGRSLHHYQHKNTCSKNAPKKLLICGECRCRLGFPRPPHACCELILITGKNDDDKHPIVQGGFSAEEASKLTVCHHHACGCPDVLKPQTQLPTMWSLKRLPEKGVIQHLSPTGRVDEHGNAEYEVVREEELHRDMALTETNKTILAATGSNCNLAMVTSNESGIACALYVVEYVTKGEGGANVSLTTAIAAMDDERVRREQARAKEVQQHIAAAAVTAVVATAAAAQPAQDGQPQQQQQQQQQQPQPVQQIQFLSKQQARKEADAKRKKKVAADAAATAAAGGAGNNNKVAAAAAQPADAANAAATAAGGAGAGEQQAEQRESPPQRPFVRFAMAFAGMHEYTTTMATLAMMDGKRFMTGAETVLVFPRDYIKKYVPKDVLEGLRAVDDHAEENNAALAAEIDREHDELDDGQRDGEREQPRGDGERTASAEERARRNARNAAAAAHDVDIENEFDGLDVLQLGGGGGHALGDVDTFLECVFGDAAADNEDGDDDICNLTEELQNDGDAENPRLVSVSEYNNYLLRPKECEHMSFIEFQCTTTVERKEKNDEESEQQEKNKKNSNDDECEDDDENDDEIDAAAQEDDAAAQSTNNKNSSRKKNSKSKTTTKPLAKRDANAGRTPNPRWQLLPTHPRRATHEVKARSKLRYPALSGKRPPSLPAETDTSPSANVARKYWAMYWHLLIRPWREASEWYNATYQSMSAYVNAGVRAEDVTMRNSCKYVVRCTVGLQTSSVNRKLFQKYRNGWADVLMSRNNSIKHNANGGRGAAAETEEERNERDVEQYTGLFEELNRLGLEQHAVAAVSESMKQRFDSIFPLEQLLREQQERQQQQQQNADEDDEEGGNNNNNGGGGAGDGGGAAAAVVTLSAAAKERMALLDETIASFEPDPETERAGAAAAAAARGDEVYENADDHQQPDDDVRHEDLFANYVHQRRERSESFEDAMEDVKATMERAGLNDMQKEFVMDAFTKAMLYDDEDERADDPKLMWLEGPAGTGKTTATRCLAGLVRKHMNSSYAVLCCAYQGNAAANLEPGARTLHSVLGLKSFAWPATREQLNEPEVLKKFYLGLRVLIIEEISMVSAEMMWALDVQMRKVYKKDLPFGGKLVIALGDFLQIPPVKGTPLHKAAMSTKNEAAKWQASFGGWLWQHAQRYKLEAVMRARGCERQRQRLVNLRAEKKFTEAMYRDITPLTAGLVRRDPRWRNHFSLHATNEARLAAGALHLERLAITSGKRLFKWRMKVQGRAFNEHAEDLKENMYRAKPEAWGYFLEGARFMLLRNKNVQIGLTNGAVGVAHKLYFAEADMPAVQRAIDATPPNEAVELPSGVVPVRFEVAFPMNEITAAAIRANKLRAETVGDSWIVPFKEEVYESPVEGVTPKINLKGFPLTQAHALTFHKSQGLTLAPLALDLAAPHKKKGVNLNWECIYVGISRAPSDDMLCMLLPGDGMSDKFTYSPAKCAALETTAYLDDTFWHNRVRRFPVREKQPEEAAENVQAPANASAAGRGRGGGGRGRGGRAATTTAAVASDVAHLLAPQATAAARGGRGRARNGGGFADAGTIAAVAASLAQPPAAQQPAKRASTAKPAATTTATAARGVMTAAAVTAPTAAAAAKSNSKKQPPAPGGKGKKAPAPQPKPPAVRRGRQSN